MFNHRRGGGAAKIDEMAGQRAHRPDYQIILYVGLLMLIGLVTMYAIGPQRANVLNALYGTDNYSGTYFVIKQLVSLGLSITAFMVVSTIPFAWFKKHANAILITGLALCVALFVFGNLLHISSVAQCSLGACRWFELGPLGGFQPAEFLKFGLLMYLATFLGVRIRQGLINSVEKTVIPAMLVTLVALFFVVIVQNDMGTGIALGSVAASVLMVSGISRRVGIKLIVATLVLGAIAVAIAPHRLERIATFLNGDDHSVSADAGGYHIRNAMIALGTGGLLGRGIGNSIQATGYLPEAINDSVFAVMGETFGFVGVCVILGIFAALLLRLLRVADHLPDPTMRLAVAGVFGWLAAHVVLNVASMIGVFPLTGITLPLLSFGGTSMLFITGAMGLVFQLSKYTVHTVTQQEADRENISGRRRIGGARFSRRRGI